MKNEGRYSGLNLNQDKATKPQTVQIVRQGEATPYWFKFNPLYQCLIHYKDIHMKRETIALHAGYQSEPTTKSAAVPIYIL